MKPQIIFPDHERQNLVHGDCDGGCDGDCACALPDVATPPSVFIKTASRDEISGIYRTKGEVTSLPLSDNLWIAMVPKSQPGWAIVNEAALSVLIFFEEGHSVNDWHETSFISRTDFVEATQIFYDASILTSDHLVLERKSTILPPLEAWLFLTRTCNMACAHCFVSKDSRDMTLETGLQAIRKLFEVAQRNGHPGVKVKYAGGEPTMRWNLLARLHDEAAVLSQNSGLPLSEIIVTNGAALSRARLEYLKNSNIQLAISLDGFGEGHDRQRPFINGLPSFDRIYKNILLALELGMRPYLTITITRLNLNELPEITEFALKNHLFLNWNFYRPHTPKDPLVADFGELLIALKKALDVVQNASPSYPFLDRLIDRSNFSAVHEHTCGAGRNYLSIDYDGRVLPCHMLSGVNRHGIALEMVTEAKFHSFDNVPTDQKTGCNTCQWRYWCTGGCPILANNIMGTSKVSSPYCSVYKAIYPELIRLQGLQLLQANINS